MIRSSLSLWVGMITWLLAPGVCHAGHWEPDALYSQPTGSSDPAFPNAGSGSTALGLETNAWADVFWPSLVVYRYSSATGTANYRYVWKADLPGEQPPQNVEGLVVEVAECAAFAFASAVSKLPGVGQGHGYASVAGVSAVANATGGPADQMRDGPWPGGGTEHVFHGDTFDVSRSANSSAWGLATTASWVDPSGVANGGGNGSTYGTLIVIPEAP